MRRFLLALILAECVRASTAGAQTLPATTPMDAWGPGRGVSATARSGDILYVGGSFTYVGPQTGPFASFDATTGSMAGRAPQGVTALNAVGALPDGGWLLSAQMATGPGRILRLDPQGVVDPAWSVNAGWFDAMATDGTRVYLAQRGDVAAFDLASGSRLWTTTFSARLGEASVSQLQVDRGLVFVQGNITFFQGAPLAAHGFAALGDGNGALAPFDLLGLDSVAAMAKHGDDFYAVGVRLSTLAGTAIDLGSGARRTWDPPTAVVGMVATPDAVFVSRPGGTSGGVNSLLTVIALSPVTAQVLSTQLVHNASGPMTLAGDRVLVATRTFTDDGFWLSDDILGFHASTFDPSPAGTKANNHILTLAAGAGRWASAGLFGSIGGVERNNIFALDLRTGLPTGFLVRPNGPVNALTLVGNYLVAGGSFTVVNGQPQVGLAAFDTTNAALLPWTPLQSGQVNALATDGRSLFAGGTFSVVNGVTRPNLVAFDLSTVQVTPWVPSPNGVVNALMVNGETLLVGGDFQTLSGAARNRLAAFSLRASPPVPTAFNPTTVRESVRTVAVANGNVVVNTYRPYAGSGDVQVFDAAGGELPIASSLPPYPFFAPYAAGGSGDVIYVSGTLQAPPYRVTLALSARTGALLPWFAPVVGDFIASYPDLLVVSSGVLTLSTPFTVYSVPSAGPPTRLHARVTGNTVSLSWSPPDGVTPTSFLLDVGTTPGATNLGRIPVGAGVVATVPPATYYARVRAVVNGTPGEASGEMILTVPATASAPNPPSGLSGAVSRGVLTLAWTAASGNAEAYVIEAGTLPGISNIAVLDTGVVDTAFVTPAPSGTFYLRIRARNAVGLSAPSNEIVLIVP